MVMMGHGVGQGGGTNTVFTPDAGKPPVIAFSDPQSLDFDGTDDIIEIPSDPILEGFSTMTMSAWIYPTATGHVNWGRIISKDNGGTSEDYHIAFTGSNTINCRIRNASDSIVNHEDTKVLTLSQWTHVTCVYDGADVVLYFDGVEGDAGSIQTGALYDNNSSLTFGDILGGAGTREFEGLIDEIRIYNRVLTVGEIAKLANGTHPATSAGGKYTIQDTLDVNGDLTINSGELDIDVINITVEDSFYNNGGLWSSDPWAIIQFDGALVTNRILSGGVLLGQMRTSGGTGTWTLDQDLALENSLWVIQGNMDFNGYDVVIDKSLIVSGYTLDLSSGITSVGENVDFTGGTVTPVTSTLVLVPYDGSRTFKAAGETVNDVLLTSNDSLIGYWKLDETAAAPVSSTDSSVNTNTGTGSGGLGNNTNGPAPNVDVTPVNFANVRSLNYDGNDDELNLGSAATLDDIGAQTQSIWMKPNTGSSGYLFSKRDAGCVGITRLGLNGTNQSLNWFKQASGTSPTAPTAVAAYVENVWSHVTLTWDGTLNPAKIYVNGTEAAYNVPITGTGTIDSDAGCDMRIGNRFDGNDTFDGELDDARLYNRVLSLAEIKALAGGHPMDATGAITLQDTMRVNGSWESTGNVFVHNAQTVMLTGTTSPHTIAGGGDLFDTIHINGTGGIWNLTSNIGIENDLIVDAGTLDLSAYDTAITDFLDVNAGTLDLNAGVTSVSGNVDFTGSATLSVTGSTLMLVPSDGTKTLIANGKALNDVAVSSNDGLVGYWKLDETTIGGASSVIDSSGSGVHGTPNNIAGPQGPSTNLAPVHFTNDRSWDFDGTEDFVDLGDNLDLIGSPLTLAAWVNMRTFASSWSAIIDKLHTSGNYRMQINGGGFVEFGIRDTGGSFEGVTSIGNVSLNKWYHIAATFDDIATGKIYINGILDNTKTDFTLARGDASSNLRIGYTSNNNTYLDGRVDDARIYNRVLTDVEIKALAGGHPMDDTGTITLQDPMTVNGDMILGDGTFAVNGAQTISLGSDWINESATFTAGNSTVDFNVDGNANIISGNNTFYNLTLTSGSAKSLTIDAGSIQTIASGGVMTVTGSGSGDVTIDSSTGSTQWDVHFTDAHTSDKFAYVNLNNSGCNTGTQTADMTGTGNANTAGNDTSCWDFTGPVTTNLYRSVGTTATDLNVDTRQVDIVGTTATFDGYMPANVGVGDALTYNITATDYLAFIVGRTSSTVFTVEDKDGGTPQATGGNNAVGVFRAYTSLNDAVKATLVQNSNITEPSAGDVNPNRNLVTADTIVNIAAYGDGADTAAAIISGWTTSATNYIHIYTPTDLTEVGVSQRHRGVWGTNAYRLEATTNTAINISDEYVRIDGLQVQVTNAGAADRYGIATDSGATDVRISNNIVKGVLSGSSAGDQGIRLVWVGSGSRTGRIWNNIVYDWINGTNGATAIVSNDSWDTYIFNNTVANSRNCFYIDGNTEVVKNNIAQGCTNDGYQVVGGGSVTADYNVSNLATDAPSASYRNDLATTVNFVDSTNGDYHIAQGDTMARDVGTDLTSDPNLPITVGIDGATRPTGANTWDLGADEAPTHIYRSVGTTATDLNTGTETVTITSGTATFDAAMPDNIGVGDALTWQTSGPTDHLAFIVGRTSDTVFTVKDKDGGVPANSDANDAVSVYRSYTSLSNWESQTQNGAITEPSAGDVDPNTDLMVANTIMHVAAYADGLDDIGTTAVDINGWTTGDQNYIHIYTPVATTEVGTSQRNDGKWDSNLGYAITCDCYYHTIVVQEQYVRLDGLQIENTRTVGSGQEGGTLHWLGMDNGAELRVTNNIMQRTNSAAGNSQTVSIEMIDSWFNGITDTKLIVANNIVSGFKVNMSIAAVDNGSVIIYNNTLVDASVENLLYTGNNATGDTLRLKNNIAQGAVSNAHYNITGPDTTDYAANISEDGTSPDGGSFQNKVVAFADAANGDYHLAGNDSVARDLGTDLTTDAYYAITVDIDGDVKPDAVGLGWDIGADEGAIHLYRSVGTDSGNLNTAPETVTITSGTAVFDGAMPANIGVGDAITYVNGGNQLAFIHSRTNDTTYIVKDKDGGIPTNSTASQAANVYRSYNSLFNWESLTQNTNITEPTPGDVDPSVGLVANNTVMNVAAYGDGPDTAAVDITGWTSGANNYVKVYTPVSASEVGISQRHNGVWDDNKYRLEVSNAVPLETNGYVWVDGLQIEATLTNFNSRYGIMNTGIDVSISNNIIKGVITGTSTTIYGIYSLGAAKIWNNIIYDWVNGSNSCAAIVSKNYDHYVYNNTVHNSYIGIWASSGPIYAQNNIVQSSPNGYHGSMFDASSDYNVSNVVSDAPSPSYRTNLVTTVNFLDDTNDDFHIDQSDTMARDVGVDLTNDATIAFSVDIDGASRPIGANTWDLGADEAPIHLYRSVGTTTGNLEGSHMSLSARRIRQ